jgi:hypothetical protein
MSSEEGNPSNERTKTRRNGRKVKVEGKKWRRGDGVIEVEGEEERK